MKISNPKIIIGTAAIIIAVGGFVFWMNRMDVNKNVQQKVVEQIENVSSVATLSKSEFEAIENCYDEEKNYSKKDYLKSFVEKKQIQKIIILDNGIDRELYVTPNPDNVSTKNFLEKPTCQKSIVPVLSPLVASQEYLIWIKGPYCGYEEYDATPERVKQIEVCNNFLQSIKRLYD